MLWCLSASSTVRATGGIHLCDRSLLLHQWGFQHHFYLIRPTKSLGFLPHHQHARAANTSTKLHTDFSPRSPPLPPGCSQERKSLLEHFTLRGWRLLLVVPVVTKRCRHWSFAGMAAGCFPALHFISVFVVPRLPWTPVLYQDH